MKRLMLVANILIVASMLLSACATPTPEVVEKIVEKVVTQVVTQVVEVEKEVTKIVAGTPVVEKVVETKIVEKEVTKVVEKVVTAAPEPTPEPTPVPPLERAEEQVLRIAHYYSWRWDPATATGTDHTAGQKIFWGGLMEINKDGKVVPFAAEKVDVSEDGKTYTYTLREGLIFSPTGTPVTAADVKWSWERNVRAGTVVYRHLKTVKGFTEYADEKADEMTGLVVVDDRTFRVEFEVFDALWWETQGAPSLSIMEKAQIERGTPEHHWCEGGCGGVGRYVIEEINMDEMWVWLVKNPYYWGDDNTGPDRIYITRIPDEQTRLLMYETGELDIVILAGAALRSLLQPDHPLYGELSRVDTQGYANLILRADRAPFDDPKFREAVYYAIDYQGIVDDVYGGAYSAANANVGHFGAYGEVIKDWPTFAQDVERARKAFAESTYAGDPSQVPAIRLYSSTGGPTRLWVQAMQENIRDVLGVSVDLVITDSALRPEEQESEQFQAWSAGGMTYEPVELLYDLWACDGAYNETYAHWCDEEMTALMKEAMQIVDQDKRLQLMAQADQILLDAHVNLVQWWYTSYFLTKPYVQNERYGRKGPMIWNWEEIWISK